MNSPLVSHTEISPNRTTPRNHKIDTITIHCTAGHINVRALGKLFSAKGRMASSNYGIDDLGHIALYVDEADRSWCSSNAANDNRAVIPNTRSASERTTRSGMRSRRRLNDRC